MNENENETNNDMTAGQMLRLARTTGRRKRELNTVARLLCIKTEFLEALENDEFYKIPELVYILGFARNYAMELDLDPYVVVDKIKKQMGLLEEKDAIEIEGEEPTGISSDKAPRRPSWIWGFLRKNSGILLITAIVLTTLAVISTIAVRNRPSNPETVAREEPIEIGAATRYSLPVKREYGLRNRDYAAVVLQATGTTWVQIKNSGGTVIFEHSMVAGDIYYALNGSVAAIGNVGAMDVWVNGKKIPTMGAEHQRLIDVILTPENLVK